MVCILDPLLWCFFFFVLVFVVVLVYMCTCDCIRVYTMWIGVLGGQKENITTSGFEVLDGCKQLDEDAINGNPVFKESRNCP